MNFSQKPNVLDVLILSIFTILITLYPYYLHGQINIFEVGLYLPGIQSVLNGEIPFRDFFHLRGPFELYMPAALMKIFGIHLKYLSFYFYFGTVLCLILSVFIAKELLNTRLMLYVFVPVFVARTFPRVVFTYWGGMRYAFGLLAMWLAIKFFKKERSGWLLAAGLTTAAALFTSIEMGIYAMMGILFACCFSYIFKIHDRTLLLRSVAFYMLGVTIIAGPYVLYLAANQAFGPYIESVRAVVSNMQNVFNPHLVSEYPSNFKEALMAMANPVHTNFKHMTPSYLYIAILIYLIIRFKNKTFSKTDVFILCLSIYGFIMYNTGFRGIWAAQFEMALQPEKIILFFLFELMLFQILPQWRLLQNKKWLMSVICGLFVIGSIGYSIQRYNHRFFAFKFLCHIAQGKDPELLKPGHDGKSRPLTIERASGMIVPLEQAQELEEVEVFVKKNVPPVEVIFTYPELGAYNFLVNRRYLGRFPMATFAWFNDHWHAELMNDLEQSKVKYIILQKQMPDYWKAVYLGVESNRKMYKDVMDFIAAHYTVAQETKSSYIYKLKDSL